MKPTKQNKERRIRAWAVLNKETGNVGWFSKRKSACMNRINGGQDTGRNKSKYKLLSCEILLKKSK